MKEVMKWIWDNILKYLLTGLAMVLIAGCFVFLATKFYYVVVTLLTIGLIYTIGVAVHNVDYMG